MARMICPDCGIEMTHHATRVILPRNEKEEALFDEELGGVALERHECPGCGQGASSLGEPS